MKSVAVYKTDVDNQSNAQKIMEEILRCLENVDASFDLDDRDNVLRVESMNGGVDEVQIEVIVKKAGFRIEELV